MTVEFMRMSVCIGGTVSGYACLLVLLLLPLLLLSLPLSLMYSEDFVVVSFFSSLWCSTARWDWVNSVHVVILSVYKWAPLLT